jgi:antitoxin MazE
MAVRKRTRKTDSKGRVLLPADFANALVIVDRVSDDEIRIRKAKVAVKRISLRELLAGIPDKANEQEVDWGPPIGEEVW